MRRYVCVQEFLYCFLIFQSCIPSRELVKVKGTISSPGGGGNPRESQDVKSTAGSLGKGSPKDLAGRDDCSALWKAASVLESEEGNQRARKRKVRMRSTRKQGVSESKDGVEGDLREQRNNYLVNQEINTTLDILSAYQF